MQLDSARTNQNNEQRDVITATEKLREAAMASNINDFCRFCMKNMRISGVLGHCTTLFDKNKKPPSIPDRLMHVGLAIKKRSGKSNRVCRGCVSTLSGVEKYLPLYWRWVENEKDDESCARESATNSEKRNREPTPSKTPRALKRFCHKATSPGITKVRRSINAAITKQNVCDTEESKIVEHITNRKWAAAAKFIMNHKDLTQEVKKNILSLLENECKAICNPNNNFILWRSSPEDLKSFSFDKLESDLQRLSPLMFSIFAAICNNSSPVICAASAIALRGRQPRLSAFAHYLNCVLLYGGAKKAVFDRLSKLAITTAHTNAIGKQKELANTCEASLFLLKRLNESFLTLETECHRNVVLREGKKAMSPSRKPELIPTDVFLSTEELQLSEEELECSEEKATEEGNLSVLLPESQPTPPNTYSIIMDNLDFFMHAHHQSTLHSNRSIHWIHHIAVQDRIPTHHLANDVPLLDLQQYNLTMSLPGHETQTYMRREFIVIGSRILTQHLAVFKSFRNVVVHHIPHQYSEEMAQPSTDHPLGLIFKNENKTTDLSEVLQEIQHKYAPKGPDGVSKILVGGDRLTEANCRNIQCAFADGNTNEERLEGMVFKFEDWHAIRVLFEIHYKVFFSGKSGKDHGTLCANMTKLSCDNAQKETHLLQSSSFVMCFNNNCTTFHYRVTPCKSGL
uniref:DUF6589 domain-containing protein n=1 Tax=Nothobranchius rachovii TaxID=451742 RepID=A0A1A8Q9J2_9TELE